MPDLSCLKKIGPLDEALTAKATKGINQGYINNRTKEDTTTSNTRLMILFNSSCKGSSLKVITGIAP